MHSKSAGRKRILSARSAICVVGCMALTIVMFGASAASAAFPDDPPNDPDYPNQTYLFDHIPSRYRNASDPEGSSGMWVDRAWREFTAGDPDTLIAYFEGGINWHGGSIADLAPKIYLNRGELGAALGEAGCYIDNGDPWFNASDFACTPDHNGNGFVDAEDMIVEYSDGTDDDGNGYVDDISGWDFYNDQNDPATLDTAYTHPNGQMRRAAAVADDGYGRAGVCPLCSLMPVKVGAEALDAPHDLAAGWVFAVDSGADVILTENAALGYSTALIEAQEYAWDNDVLVVETTHDFNSTAHQGGMWHPHSITGNAMVANTTGIDQHDLLVPLKEFATTTFRERSGYTAWGAKNNLTFAASGGTTSEATGIGGGVVALVTSFARNPGPECETVDDPVTGPELWQVLMQTASDVNDSSPSWPNREGWDLQYGYGRPNVYEAMRAICDGEIPPVAWFDGPRWFSVYDPTVTSVVPIAGVVDAPRSDTGYDWVLEYGLGAEPTHWQRIAGGSQTEAVDGSLGELDLAQIPNSFYTAAFGISKTKVYETNEQYTVTLRLSATDSDGRRGEERRAIAVRHDETWLDGFPRKGDGLGGIESQPKLVDLAGLGTLQLVYGDTDGFVHALDPISGTELAGWPVAVAALSDPPSGAVDLRNEPIANNVAVGDLDGDGNLSVVVATGPGNVYAWDEDATLRPGFPVALDTGVSKPAIPRPMQPFSRPPIQGAFASPVVVDVDGDGDDDIVQGGWDGRLHVLNGDGTELEGWPVKVELPADFSSIPGLFPVQDEKISTNPAIADLDGDGDIEIVVRTQMNEVSGEGLQPGSVAHLLAYHHDGTPVDGWPATAPGTVSFYGSAQEFVTEGSTSPVVADVDGDGDHEVALSPLFSPTYLFDGDGSLRAVYGASPDQTLLSDPSSLFDGGLPTDLPVAFAETGAFGRFGATLSYAQSGSNAGSVAASLLLPGSGLPIETVERAYDALTGLTHVGFGSKFQGIDFLGAPVIADVTGDGDAEIIESGDSSVLHAYQAGGGQAPGFPKFHSGWTLWSPSVGDLDSDGDVEVVANTREGYTFVWSTPGRTDANDEWWSFHHDEANSGQYGFDARPPGALRDIVQTGDSEIAFVAPGDDWYSGTPSAYFVATDGGDHIVVPATASAGDVVSMSVPAGTLAAVVQAVDDAGNLGRAASVLLDPGDIGEAPAPISPTPSQPTNTNPLPALPGPLGFVGEIVNAVPEVVDSVVDGVTDLLGGGPTGLPAPTEDSSDPAEEGGSFIDLPGSLLGLGVVTGGGIARRRRGRRRARI